MCDHKTVQIVRTLSENELEEFLLSHQKDFQAHEETGAEADIECLKHRGGILVQPGATPEFVLPEDVNTVVVEGDLIVEGLLEQPFQSAFLVIFGNLKARHLVTCSYLIVTGNVEIDGVFYGNCTNYPTLVCGDFKANETITEKNHHFAVCGKTNSNVRLDDEEDGDEETAKWMKQNGTSSHDEVGLAKILRTRK